MTKCPSCGHDQFSELTTLNIKRCLNCLKKYPIDPNKPIVK